MNAECFSCVFFHSDCMGDCQLYQKSLSLSFKKWTRGKPEKDGVYFVRMTNGTVYPVILEQGRWEASERGRRAAESDGAKFFGPIGAPTFKGE